MNVNTATANGATSASASSTSSSLKLDSNTFLQLMLAQMKNQDPTSPMDTSQYMSQLASISQVEQSVETNSKLDSLLSQQSIAQGAGLVGKTVSSMDGTTSGVVQSVSIYSDGAVANLDNGSNLLVSNGIVIG